MIFAWRDISEEYCVSRFQFVSAQEALYRQPDSILSSCLINDATAESMSAHFLMHANVAFNSCNSIPSLSQ